MKKNIFVLLLFILVILLVSYLIYDNIILKENDIKDFSSKQFDLIEAGGLIDKIFYSNIYEYTDDVKMRIIYNNLDKNKIKVESCDSLYLTMNNDGIINSGNGNYVIDNDYSCNENIDTVDYNYVLELYEQLFGKKDNISKERIFVFDYIESKNIYSLLTPNYLDSNLFYDVYNVESANIINGKLVIEVLYHQLSKNDGMYYSTVTEDSYTNDEVYRETFSEVFISKYKDFMEKLTYTFKQYKGNWVLEFYYR